MKRKGKAFSLRLMGLLCSVFLITFSCDLSLLPGEGDVVVIQEKQEEMEDPAVKQAEEEAALETEKKRVEEEKKKEKEELKKELKEELSKELTEEIKEDLSKKVSSEVDDLKDDLKKEVSDEVKENLETTLKKEIGDNLKEELENPISEKVKEQLTETLTGTINEKIDEIEKKKQELAEQEKAEKERLEKEERGRAEKERLEQERIEKERAEQERLEQELKKKQEEEQSSVKPDVPDDAENLDKDNGSSDLVNAPIISEVEVKEREWSLLVYMAADNNLESSAIEDLTEMELSYLDTDRVSVFVLLDRNPSYDITNDNWAGTRLYKLKTGKQSSSRVIISEEIDCKELGLVKNQEVELDMSSGTVLSDAISFVTKRYPANNFGLIMWGHGTGWRGETDLENQDFSSAVVPGGVKGFAYDETSRTYMTLKQFGEAVKNGMNGNKLDFLGFDTCFGMEMEVLYELRNSAVYAAGSEGLLMASGWNYTDFFNSLDKSESVTGKEMSALLVEKFKGWYGHTNGATIAAVNLNKIEDCFHAFDGFMGTVAGLINTRDIRDEVMEVLYSGSTCETERYTYGSKNSDVYLDAESCVIQLSRYFGLESVQQKANDFYNSFSKAVEAEWSSNGKGFGIGVYFQTISSGTILSAVHPSAYIQGKTLSQIDFVMDSAGYVPKNDRSDSLLEKLFYKSF